MTDETETEATETSRKKPRTIPAPKLRSLMLSLTDALVSDDDEHWAYRQGHSDETIAHELELDPEAVGRWRRNAFGKFPPQQHAAESMTLALRVDALENRVSALEQRLLAKAAPAQASDEGMNGPAADPQLPIQSS